MSPFEKDAQDQLGHQAGGRVNSPPPLIQDDRLAEITRSLLRKGLRSRSAYGFARGLCTFLCCISFLGIFANPLVGIASFLFMLALNQIAIAVFDMADASMETLRYLRNSGTN